MNFHNTWKNCGPLEMGFTQAEYTLAALHHFAPQLRGRITGIWKKLKTWRRHEMLRRAPTISPVVVRGIAGLAWVQGRLDVRSGCEVLRLRFCDCMHFGGTIVFDLGFTKTGSRKGAREQSQSQTVRSPVCFGISVVIAVLQNIECACLHAISGNIFRASFLSSILATKVLPCIPCGAVVLHISSVSLETSAQHLNVAGGC